MIRVFIRVLTSLAGGCGVTGYFAHVIAQHIAEMNAGGYLTSVEPVSVGSFLVSSFWLAVLFFFIQTVVAWRLGLFRKAAAEEKESEDAGVGAPASAA